MNANTMNHTSPALLQPHRMRMSPLAVAAAVAIILFCGVGIASMTGLLPSAFSQKNSADEAALAEQARTNTDKANSPVTKSSTTAARVAGTQAPTQMAAATCASCGTVESVNTVAVKGEGTGLGAVGGGVVGGLLGNQVGNGRGNTVMTVLGAAGGAFAGNEIEKNVRKKVSYRVTVRMDDGSVRTVSQPQPPSVAAGDKVRVTNGAVVARS